MAKLALLVSLMACIGCSNALLSHEEAVRRLTAAGLTIWSSGGCSDRYNPDCTSFDQIREDTISGIITLKQASGCDINVTGGTETGHGNGEGYSHWNGYKVDISLSACVENYITANFVYIGLRGDGAPMWQSGAGNVYAKEGNHWDIVYYNCGGCN